MELELLDFRALWDLIDSRFTEHMHQRHIVAINRICGQRQNGIFLDELPQFTKLLKLCKDHIQSERLEFLSPIINLLSITLKPYITAKSFEKIESFDIIKQHFELISCLLSTKYMLITITISKGIQEYICDVLDYKVINESGVIDALVDGIRSWCYGARWNVEENHKEIKNKNKHILNIELSLELIAAIKSLSYSEVCAATLVDASNILDLKILYDVEMNDMFLNHSVELLWNLIESLPFENIEKYICADYFNIFSALLTKYMKEINVTNKSEQKQLRNCILSILLILSKHESMHKYFEGSQIINILLKYCDCVLSNKHLNNNHQDFQLLCIIYSIIHRVCKCYRILSVLIHERFFDHVVDTLFDDDTNCIKSKVWTDTQLTNMRTQLLSIFQTLIQIIPKYFFKHRMINKLFRFFVYYQQSISHHHSINKHVDIVSTSLLRLFSKCFHKLIHNKSQMDEKYNLSLSNLVIAASLKDIVHMDCLCNILLQIINHVSFEQCTRTDAVLIISYLSTLDIESNPFKHTHAQDIIQCICILLSTLPPSLEYYHDFQHSMMHCLRNVLHPSNTLNQAVFLNEKGIQILLNLIQKSNPSVIENAMRLLLQLSSNKDFIAQIKTFQKQSSVQSILLNVWDKCEANASDVMNQRVMRSIHCLYKQLRSVVYSRDINAIQQHKVTKILTHSQLIQGKQWTKLEQELKEESIELITTDSNELKCKLNKYKTMKNQLVSADKTLKIVADKKLEENLHDLMNKLNTYKSQKCNGKNSTKHRKENKLASSIKLNKDQKDEIVARSLQLNETMKKVLGE